MIALSGARERMAKMSAAIRKTSGRQELTGWLLVALAILLRARQYFFNRSLWGDEVMLALNIVNRSFSGLLRPLQYSQSPPLGFLYIEKLFITLFGNHDHILRLFPFLAGIAAIFVMAWLAKRILPGWAGLAALGIFTFSWQSVYYASEVRSYSSDVLFTLILIAAAHLCSGTQVPRRNWLWLLGAGMLAPWMSHPSVFVIAGIGIVLGIANLIRATWSNLIWLFSSILFWGSNFAIIFILSLRHIVANKMLLDFFRKAFMPLPPWHDWGWFLRSSEVIFENLLHMPMISGLAVLLIGIFYMVRRNWKTTALLLTPIAAACMASGLGKYPFWTRFLLFALPLLCFFLAAGMRALYGQAARFIPKIRFLFSAVIVAMIFWQPVVFSVQKFRSPENKKDIKSLMAALRADRQPQDSLYVHYASQKQFKYYAGFYGMHRNDAVIGTTAKESAAPLVADIDALAGRSRVWFLFANRFHADRFDQEKSMLEHLEHIGVQRKKYHATGANLYLYDLSRP